MAKPTAISIAAIKAMVRIWPFDKPKSLRATLSAMIAGDAGGGQSGKWIKFHSHRARSCERHAILSGKWAARCEAVHNQ